MRVLGRFTALIGLATAVAAIYIGVQAIPDIKRYLKIRSM